MRVHFAYDILLHGQMRGGFACHIVAFAFSCVASISLYYMMDMVKKKELSSSRKMWQGQEKTALFGKV